MIAAKSEEEENRKKEKKMRFYLSIYLSRIYREAEWVRKIKPLSWKEDSKVCKLEGADRKK